MIEALFDRLHKQANARADKEIKSAIAQLEKQKQQLAAGKEARVKELLGQALKKLVADKVVEKDEETLIRKKYGLPAPQKPISRSTDYGCGAMGTGPSGNRC